MSDLLLGFLFYVSLTVVTALLVVINRRLIYWRQRGVSHKRPKFIFGNLLERHGKQSLYKILTETYDYFKSTCEPFCGLYFYTEPVALILNRELAVRLLTTDRQNFQLLTPLIEKNSLQTEVGKEFDLFSTKFAHKTSGNITCDVYEACATYISTKYGIKKETVLRLQTHKFCYAAKQCYPKYFQKISKIEISAIHCDILTTLLSLALLELARNPALQKKSFSEVEKMCEKYRNMNQLENESLKELPSLKILLEELWQHYTPFTHLMLRALEHYKTGYAGFEIEQRKLLIIPINTSDSSHAELKSLIPGSACLKHQIIHALTCLLKRYQFYTCANTLHGITLRDTLPYRTFRGEIFLSVEKR